MQNKEHWEKATIFIVDAIFMPSSQLGKRVIVGLLLRKVRCGFFSDVALYL
ncbi:hypothetical protein [Aquabacterium sp.]|uniref:hypothetical protein n=1 Tax=Aquabacterium sp. TaxID=1872578 RepID=UPI004037FC82